MQISESQQNVIRIIENNLSIKFKGSTKEEATQFISSHIDSSKEQAQKVRTMYMEERIREDEAEGRDMDEFFFQ